MCIPLNGQGIHKILKLFAEYVYSLIFMTREFANLKSKSNFIVNIKLIKLIPYPMDNCYSGRRGGPAKQEKKQSCVTTGRAG